MPTYVKKLDKYSFLIFTECAPVIFAVLFITVIIMVGYLMEKGLYPVFKVFKEEALIFPFKFRDYAKKNNKYLLIVYYLFMTSCFLLFIVFMTELFIITKEEAPIVIHYIVLGTAALFSLIIGLVIYGMSKEKYY